MASRGIEFTPLRSDGLPQEEEDDFDDDFDDEGPRFLMESPGRCTLECVNRVVALSAILVMLFVTGRLIRPLFRGKAVASQCDCGEDCLSSSGCVEGGSYLWPEFCAPPPLSARAAADATRGWRGFDLYAEDCAAYHELAKHGTCTAYATTGYDYFDAAKAAYDAVFDATDLTYLFTGDATPDDAHSFQRNFFYDAFGGDAAVTASCDGDCSLAQLFACFERDDRGGFLPDRRPCDTAVREQTYTNSCSACDTIFLDAGNTSNPREKTNHTAAPKPARDDRLLHEEASGCRTPLVDPPDFDYFLFALVWDTTTPTRRKRLLVHGLWPEYATIRHGPTASSTSTPTAAPSTHPD
mmetsp:Transcript_5040/g.16511  ORF Transcript_5040/g.16511 Transcript_5040/m.16511 type:complete len:353 (+) Transcript_5040:40-1098(+)